jgi:hypothetical protein
MEIKISSAKELRSSILFLEEKKRQQEKELHNQLENTYESFKSVNLIKSALQNIFGKSDQNSLLLPVAGTIGSAVVKRIISGSSESIIKRILAASLGWVISSWFLRKVKRQ